MATYISQPRQMPLIAEKRASVETISRRYNKDPRTIRNWLKRVDDILQSVRGEQHL